MAPSERLTVQEAATTTGWSPRMLRYLDEHGIVVPERTPAGYRMYGAAELQRLRTLRELLDTHDLSLTDVGFAVRMRTETAVRDAVEGWLSATPEPPTEVETAGAVDASAWLRFEQDKHQRLLAAVRRLAPPTTQDPQGSHTSVKESA